MGTGFIITSKTGADEARQMQRSPSEDVWALVESDLRTIIDENLLPAEVSASDFGRVDTRAAKAMLKSSYQRVFHFRPGICRSP